MDFSSILSKEVFLFLAIVVLPIGTIVVLDTRYHNRKNHPTTEKEAPTRKEKEDKKYPPGERDTKMRNAIKAHKVSQIRSLLEGHDLTMAKSKQNKAYQRFTKGLYGGWDWELCKQLSPRLGITLFWTLFFNPFYFLSTYSAFQFLKFPLKSVGYGVTAFSYAMQFIGVATDDHRFADQTFKAHISSYWPYLYFANIMYMLYRLYTDIKAPSYLMMILASDQFTPEEKKSLQALFYTKVAAGKNPQYKPSAMQTYGIICRQHKEAENIEGVLTNLEANIKHNDEEDKPRGHAWIMSVWLPLLMARALRVGIFYSGLSFTYIALPPSSDGTYKISTYTDGIALSQEEYAKDEPNGQRSIDIPKLMWKIWPLVRAVLLHSGLPSEYQLPEVQARS